MTRAEVPARVGLYAFYERRDPEGQLQPHSVRRLDSPHQHNRHTPVVIAVIDVIDETDLDPGPTDQAHGDIDETHEVDETGWPDPDSDHRHE